MNLIGHGTERAFLGRLLSENGLPHHAFLVSGPEGVGKSVFGAVFSAMLLGIDAESVFSCQDFRHITPSLSDTGKEREIPVDSVREGGVFLSRFPAEAARRVLLVESAERMSEEAQNALLKALEEPNGTSVIVLVTSRPFLMLPTIRSRAFRIPLSLVPADTIRTGVEAEFGEKACAELAPFFYELGRPGVVIDALRDPKRFAARAETLRSLFRLRDLSATDRITLAERLSDSVPEAVRLLEWLSSGLRATRVTEEASPRRIAETYRTLEAVEEAIRALRSGSANARLVLDRLFLTVF